jgi:branched-chain amino acid aminotransferase
MALGRQIRTFWNGRWHEGNLPVMGSADHGSWQGTLVFDGARAFEGVTPDLDLHCRRIIRSAEVMGLDPPVSAEEIAAIARDGLRAYAPGTAVYIRPMMWSLEAIAYVMADPASTVFCLCLEDVPMAEPRGLSLTVSSFRRPDPRTALTESKSGGLYANNARVLREARAKGFDNALSLDLQGNVAETASTNVFMVRGGEVFTPAANGTFLNGITRQRVIGLLRGEGIGVRETSLTLADFAEAEEIFLTGNANKVLPVTRYEDRELPYGPVARRARALYWDFAHAARAAAQ